MKLTQKSKGFILLSSNLCAVKQAAGSHRDDMLSNQVKLVAFFVPKTAGKEGEKLRTKKKRRPASCLKRKIG